MFIFVRSFSFFEGGGGGDYYRLQNQLSSPLAMGDNRHLQPWSCLQACIMAGELKILKINLKSEDTINFYVRFL